VSPILVRPVREQLEHDRVIRLLQVRLKRRNEVATNIGGDQTVPVKIGTVQIYPDLVLTTNDRARKLTGTVEVETAESVNHLEAMAQWAHLGRAKAPFHLYVPANCVDIARRLAAENNVNVAELWSFHTIGDQTRFTLVHKATPAEAKKAAPAKSDKAEKPAAKKAAAPKKAATARKTAKAGARVAKKSAAKRSVKTQKRK
jgi:pyruvate/2-oxoglutarate dehydrogenase complex dihydrolipoamide acyltransferase (E2) component